MVLKHINRLGLVYIITSKDQIDQWGEPESLIMAILVRVHINNMQW